MTADVNGHYHPCNDVRCAEIGITATDIGQRIAEDIRGELVCCEAYDGTGKYPQGHAICYWGEAAALIAERGVR